MALKSSSLPVLAMASLLVGSFALGAETAPLTEVGAETQAVAEAGEPTPVGERLPRRATPLPGSTTTRAERKAEALQALRNGQLIAAGDSHEYYAAQTTRQASTLTRAERMAATLAAAKAHQLAPAGEGAMRTGP